MCRALLYLGEPVAVDALLYRPDSALVKQSYMPRMLQMLNLAGFGMTAWDATSLSPDVPFRYHSTELPVFDRNLESLATKVRAHCFLGHVRGVPLSSAATVSTYNTHPFSYPGSGFVMAHNGDVAGFDVMREELRGYLRPEIAARIVGSTDSEWIYALFLSQFEELGRFQDAGSVRAAVESTLEIIGRVRERCDVGVSSSVNLFITDGSRAFAIRYCFDFGCYATDSSEEIAEPSLNYLSLWYTSGREYGFYDGEWQMIGGPSSADSIMIASEPLTTDTSRWLEVPEYSMLIADRRDGVPHLDIQYLGI